MSKKITVVEVYQKITAIMTGLSAGIHTSDSAALEFAVLAEQANRAGLSVSFPTAAELRERHTEKTIFESSEEPYYEESYESSQVC
jgi:hypothetical protein